jgi:hypothetical protein
VLPSLIALLTIGILLLLVVYLRRRGKRASQEEAQRSLNPQKFDTTLGEFHDMREALRPLVHTRTASRRDPKDQRKQWPKGSS